MSGSEAWCCMARQGKGRLISRRLTAIFVGSSPIVSVSPLSTVEGRQGGGPPPNTPHRREGTPSGSQLCGLHQSICPALRLHHHE